MIASPTTWLRLLADFDDIAALHHDHTDGAAGSTATATSVPSTVNSNIGSGQIPSSLPSLTMSLNSNRTLVYMAWTNVCINLSPLSLSPHVA
jgi:hypothetical protein